MVETVRITDMQHSLLTAATMRVKSANEHMATVSACILAGSDLPPNAELVEEGRDETGRYLVVKVPE